MTIKMGRPLLRIVAAGVVLALVLAVIVVPLLQAVGRVGDDDDAVREVDMEQLRHAVAEDCGLDERRMVEPYLWAAGASWRVAGTTQRPSISFAGGGTYCGA